MTFFLILGVVALCVRLLVNSMAKRQIRRLFLDHSVLVTGEKGSGKDLLFGYVISRRRKYAYISNVDYGGKCIPFEPTVQFGCGGNNLVNLIEGTIAPYEYPYEDGIDYFISDGGCYFPSQENGLLDRRYRSVPLFAALSRHLGDCRIHVNVQLPSRLWNKLREQATRYIWVEHSFVLGRFVRMRLYIYDRLESCQDRVKPMRRAGGKYGRAMRAESEQAYGVIRRHTIYFIKNYKYDDRAFKARLRGEILEDVSYEK